MYRTHRQTEQVFFITIISAILVFTAWMAGPLTAVSEVGNRGGWDRRHGRCRRDDLLIVWGGGGA